MDDSGEESSWFHSLPPPMPSTGSRRVEKIEGLCCIQDNWSETLPVDDLLSWRGYRP